MTTNELLLPRFKVIADFPQWSAFRIEKGDILVKNGIHFVGGNSAKAINENEIEKYPAIFREMHWSEDRTPEQLPKYVKWFNGDVHKYSDIDWSAIINRWAFEPATEADYLTYQNHKP